MSLWANWFQTYHLHSLSDWAEVSYSLIVFSYHLLIVTLIKVLVQILTAQNALPMRQAHTTLVMQPFWVFILLHSLRDILRLVLLASTMDDFYKCDNMFRVLGSGLRTMTWIFLEKNRYLSTLAVASSQSPADRYGWLALVRRKFYSIYSFLLFCLGDRQPVCVSPFAFYHNLVLILNKAEHHVIYQYRLVNAANHYMGLIQTESVSPNSFLRIYNQPILTWMILALFPTQTCASGAFQSRTDLQWSLSLSKKSIGVGAKHHKLQ